MANHRGKRLITLPKAQIANRFRICSCIHAPESWGVPTQRTFSAANSSLSMELY
jgi:hypothetical protein